MQLNIRKLAPVFVATTLVLAGCKTAPTTPGDGAAPAGGAQTSQGTPQQGSLPASASPVEFFVAQSQAGPGLIEVKLPDGVLFLQRQPVLTRSDLSEAAALVDRQGQNFVGLRFTEAGARKLNQVSAQNVGNMLALVVNRELVAAPRIAEPLNRGVLAFGVPSAEAASSIAARIRGDQVAPAAQAPSQPGTPPNPASPMAPASQQ